MKALAAEMARNFGKRLEPLGLSVRELTGDMHLTKPEIMATSMIITTPEKWDVTTRKPGLLLSFISYFNKIGIVLLSLVILMLAKQTY